ncbi:hypothetical protein L208DRAFT_1390953 [Tricholoma matsutake]|nr:hypothetical protein L208DRAFT_1390953 [Tricholoma matsutake 945]
MIDQIQNEVEDATGKIPNFSRNIHYFLVPETMDHILTRCESPGQKEVWKLAKQMWAQKSLKWRQPWIGNIISCTLTEFKTNDGES